jgi:hypothetical protein
MYDDGVTSSVVPFIPRFARFGQLFKRTQHGHLSRLLLRN